jgi:hypothetical protein
VTNDSVLPASVYKQYYKREWITPKIMANLICDNNPDTSLLSRDTKYKNTLRCVLYAIERGDLTSKDGKRLNNSEIKTQALFLWAINKFTEFQAKLPTNMIINSGGEQAKLPAMTGQAFALDLPTDYQELRQAYVQLHLEQMKLKKENLELKNRLSIFENQKKVKIINSSTGGNNSGAKPKSF